MRSISGKAAMEKHVLFGAIRREVSAKLPRHDWKRFSEPGIAADRRKRLILTDASVAGEGLVGQFCYQPLGWIHRDKNH
jgi:hypothetical protein